MKIELIPQSVKTADPQTIRDKVKTLADAYAITGIVNPSLELSDSLSKYADTVTAFINAMVITEVLNEGWVPDWKNKNQEKWQLFFDLKGSAVSLLSVLFNFEGSYVPSRLCFKSRELAEYAYSQFPEVFNSFIIN